MKLSIPQIVLATIFITVHNACHVPLTVNIVPHNNIANCACLTITFKSIQLFSKRNVNPIVKQGTTLIPIPRSVKSVTQLVRIVQDLPHLSVLSVFSIRCFILASV